MANIPPAKLGQGENEPLYIAPSQEYEQNKNIDLIYGNKDGKISLKEYADFVILRGNEEGFRQYNPKPTVLQSNLNLNPNYRPVVMLVQCNLYKHNRHRCYHCKCTPSNDE